MMIPTDFMRKTYENIDPVRVGFYQSILEEAGIATLLKNENSSIGAGEIPFTQTFPELWVVEDAEYDRAIALLAPYHGQAASSATGNA